MYVCEIIIMGTFAKSPGLDKKTFDKKRNLFDNQLGRQFVIFPDIRFPLHYDIDGVHVNEKMAEFHADLKRLYATIFLLFLFLCIFTRS